MAIRKTSELRNYAHRVVSNFNRRRQSALKAGFRNLPDKQYVSELLRRFDKRKDLIKELKLLDEFRRTTLSEVENSAGTKAREWNIAHIKNNLEQAKKFYDNRAKILSERSSRFPSERDELNTVLSNRASLEYNLDSLSEEQLDDMEGAIKTFVRSRNKWGAGYRGFMSEVEEVMARTGISKDKRDEFFKKFKKLNHEEFFYLYDESQLIKRIYALIDSPKRENEMNAEVKDAKGYVKDLMQQIDLMIDEAKNR